MALPLFGLSMGTVSAMIVGGIVARILAALGLGVISYVGVTFAVNEAVALLHSEIGGLPSDIANLLGMAGFDVFLSLVVSARTGWLTFILAHRGFRRISFTGESA